LKMKKLAHRSKSLLALFAASAALGACHKKTDSKAPTLENFKSGMLAYLKARGDLCLGKQFPIDVTDREIQTGSRDAVQMPALEQAGLVSSTEAMGEVQTDDGKVPAKVLRYRLTEAGQRYYLAREVPGQTTSTGEKVVRTDLCAVKLKLDKIVSFELSPPTQPTSAVVTYTYQVDPAPWTSTPEIQRVFPAVMNVIAGAGSAELKEGFALTRSGWVANELAPQGAAPLANR
jgi:hypothetical protein